jgi:electron-transferring-flavoprotein dehydrogenase
LISGDTSKESLKKYEELVNSSFIYKELYPTRNFRAVMQDGMVVGGLKMGVQLLTGGACMLVPKVEADCDATKTIQEFNATGRQNFKNRFASKLEYDGKLTFDKVTMVYNSKAMHDEIQPVHLRVKDDEQMKNINIKQYGLPCEAFCPAEVYELHTDKNGNESLRIHAENCVHCKTCDIKAPKGAITWTAPYGGDGPEYNMM